MKKKKTTRDKTKVIHFDVYNYYVTVVASVDPSKARSRYAKKIGHPYDGHFLGLHSYNEYESFIFLPATKRVDVIAHEAFHCIHRMLDRAGVKFDNETYAYHLGWLTQKIYDIYK